MTRGPVAVNDVWTPWRLEALRRLWDQKVSANKIASALGGGLTRNAVIGKAHRLGLAGRPSPIIRDGRTPKRRQYKPRPKLPGGRQALLEARERTEAVKAAQRQAQPAAPAAPPPPPPSPPEPRIALDARATVATPTQSRSERMTSRTCAWPIGDPREPGFHFCGATPVREGHSYCDEHHAASIQKKPATGTEPAFIEAPRARRWAS
ncbi:GcrA family cell cycle regulator [Dongia deserti]|uniref:GcrA family cell cycle regulator n=1 Tax=Dongia deserti TaxID=2268030 RepID=UPI0013C4B2C1|nr:GcrA family cell cycle regulator [Dongia deserti]